MFHTDDRRDVRSTDHGDQEAPLSTPTGARCAAQDGIM